MAGSVVPVSKVPSRNYGCINYCISEYCTYRLQPLQFQRKYLQQSLHGKLNFTKRLLNGPLICCDKLRPVAALESNAPDPIQQVLSFMINFNRQYFSFMEIVFQSKETNIHQNLVTEKANEDSVFVSIFILILVNAVK